MYLYIRTTCFRYLDDIILIWTGNKIKFDRFLNDLNKKHSSIKFDYKSSQNYITFVDFKIYPQNGKL